MATYHSSDFGWTAGQDVSTKFASLVKTTFKAGDTFVLDHMYNISGGNHQLPDNFTLAAVKGGGFDIRDTATNKDPLLYLGNGNKLDNVTIKHSNAPDTGYDGNNPAKDVDYHNKQTIAIHSKSNVTIESSKFEGNVQMFLDVRGGDHLTVQNTVFDGGAYQMRWLGGCRDFLVESSLFQNALIDGIKTSGNSTGTERATINNSVFENGRDGLDTTGGFKDGVVSNSIFRNNSVTGIDIKSPYHAENDFGTRSNSNILIENSEFINNNSGVVFTFTDYTNTVTASTADKWMPHHILITDSIFEKTVDREYGVRAFLIKAGHNIKWNDIKLLGDVNEARIMYEGEPKGWDSHHLGGTSSTGPARPASNDYPFIAGPVAGGEGAAPPALPPQQEPTPEPAPEPDPAESGAVAINAGGGAGGGFLADAHFSGGKVYSTTASIAGTSSDAVYQTERWGDFGYAIDVEDGTYDVTLKFAELVWGAAGKRLFDVKAEKQLILDDFDVFAAAGGKNIALDKTFSVVVDDGVLNLDFISLVNNAKISGLEINRVEPEPAPEPQPAPEPDPAPVSMIKLNAGGKASGDFIADAHFSGGKSYSTSAAIAKTGADAIYQSERWGNFGYDVEIENGTYDVTLKFAEIYFGAAGKRLFDVKAENKLVLDNFDVFKAAGGKNVALDKTVKVVVRDGELNLDFISVKDSAKISGIRIAPAQDGTAEARLASATWAEPDYELSFSTSAARTDPMGLDGAVLAGDVFVFTQGTEAAKKVHFYVDDESATGRPDQIERHHSHDFAGTVGKSGDAVAWDTTDVGDGEHSITAKIFARDGSVSVVTDTFIIDNF